MVEVAPVAGEIEEQLSLDTFLETWPHESYGLPEVQAFKASLLDHADLLAREDGAVLGSGFVALFPGLPESPRVMLTVPPRNRGRGAGTALYAAISDWARERGLQTLKGVVPDNDPDSLAFAERRGFVEDRREKGVALDLTAIEPPRASRPGRRDRHLGRRPELAHGMFEVSVEASPDVPGDEDEEHQSFEAWLEHDMRARATVPRRPSSRSRATRSSATRSSPSRRSRGDRLPRPDGGQARLARSRHRAGAEGSADRLGEANGYEQLQTKNDERNEPIRRLNAEFGYAPAVGRIYVRGPLA